MSKAEFIYYFKRFNARYSTQVKISFSKLTHMYESAYIAVHEESTLDWSYKGDL